MKAINYLLIVLLFTFASCAQPNGKEHSLESKDSEREAKEIVLDKKPDTIKTISVDSTRNDISKTISKADNTKELIGFWFTPHAATVNIKFLADKTFVFNDYNSALEKEEQLTGKYQLGGNILTLIYKDRAKQKFRFYKGEGADNNYYIKKPGYYFVKGEEQ